MSHTTEYSRAHNTVNIRDDGSRKFRALTDTHHPNSLLSKYPPFRWSFIRASYSRLPLWPFEFFHNQKESNAQASHQDIPTTIIFRKKLIMVNNSQA